MNGKWCVRVGFMPARSRAHGRVTGWSWSTHGALFATLSRIVRHTDGCPPIEAMRPGSSS